jgi:virginiamycin B lyase
MRKVAAVLTGLTFVCCVNATENGAGAVAYGKITTYTIPTAKSETRAIIAGPDGALWFTESATNKIGRVTTSGAFTEYTIPTAGSSPAGITVGPDSAIWFTERDAHKIGRLTTAGAFTEYAIPRSSPGGPSSITTGSDGALWFTDVGWYFAGRSRSRGLPGKIGRITAAGAFSGYVLPSPYGDPHAITTGPDGALWFIAEHDVDTEDIARMTTSGAFAFYATAAGNAYSIATGPDGALWFTDNSTGGSGKLGRITASGALREFEIDRNPNSTNSVDGIAAGPDGALWFTEQGRVIRKIRRMTTAGALTDYVLAPALGVPRAITRGPDGAMWFVTDAGMIGRITGEAREKHVH